MPNPISPPELTAILHRHTRWTEDKSGGERANLTGANLAHANLADANLPHANLAGANLPHARLTDANLTGANLAHTNLAGVNLAGANLPHARLAHANLTGANLTDANLAGVNLAHANLADVVLTGARLAWSSHDLLGEILWRAAGSDLAKRQYAALVGRARDWSWKEFLKLGHPLTSWALGVLAPWAKDDPTAPPVVQETIENTKASQ